MATRCRKQAKPGARLDIYAARPPQFFHRINFRALDVVYLDRKWQPRRQHAPLKIAAFACQRTLLGPTLSEIAPAGSKH
ncbi:MAG: hypothetical protein AAGB11_09000 [Pseudomonadota bacterium]